MLNGDSGPCLDALQIVHYSPSLIDETEERYTHRQILFI